MAATPPSMGDHTTVPDPDRQRFETLFAEQYDRVLAYAAARTDVHTAKDVAADVFLVAWRRLADVPDEPVGWLLAVARRTLATQRRGGQRRTALMGRARSDRAAGADGVDRSDPAVLVTDRDRALAALDSLGDTDRELLCLLAWDGLQPAQAATVLGCSSGALAVRTHRARHRYQAALTRLDAQPGAALPAHRPITEDLR